MSASDIYTTVSVSTVIMVMALASVKLHAEVSYPEVVIYTIRFNFDI